MRWHMRLSKFDFKVWYNKRLLNTQADVLSCVRLIEETTVPVDADVSTYPLHRYVTSTNCDGKNDFDVNLAMTTNTSPSFVSISSGEIHMSQNDNDFC